MRTIRHPIRHVLSLVGMGLMLAGLFGGPASAADVEPFDYQNDWGSQIPMVSESVGTAGLSGAARPLGAAGPVGRPA